jgi:helicase
LKRLPAGSTGAPVSPREQSELDLLGRPWATIVEAGLGDRTLRPVQRAALFTARILDSRQHLVVCAPTNSGKSLIGHLILLDAVLRGRRAVLLEPLRALAQEQAEELAVFLASLVPAAFERQPTVRLSTGDYRLEGELPSDGPPTEGEIIVATPERLDAILRSPNHQGWASTIGAVVIDEAHLLADPRRGPTLELIAASMLSLTAPPRLALLSATVGEPERLREWLQPCQLVTSTERTPLSKEVWQLDESEDPDEVLGAELTDVLAEPATAAIVFVYTRSAAEALARRLTDSLSQPVLAYHSGQSTSERQLTRARFQSGTCRCVVATTALAMGVNLPATHVLVRDTTFFGHGKLRVDELLQILGRAGRGDRSGLGAVLVRHRDDWDSEDLARSLRDEALPPLRSSFESPLAARRHGASSVIATADMAATTLVATCLGRANDGGLARSDVSELLGRTFGARSLVSRIDAALAWLSDPSHALAYEDNDARHHLTTLGLAGVRSVLPLDYVTGIGQLTRDLFSFDPTSRLLGRWSALDHVFALSLMSERTPRLRAFSEGLADQVVGWHESRPNDEKSLLFADWVVGSPESSKVDQLLGSLSAGVPIRTSRDQASARKRAYVAMLATIVLDERSRGVSIEDIERRWDVKGLAGVEEAWRDTALWILAGHTTLFEVRCFYHHLLDRCGATPDQVREAKRALGRIRGQAYDLLERLKYCSPLGPLVRGVRSGRRTSSGPALGVVTIRKLEEAGVTSLEQISQMDLNELMNTGIQRRYARQIEAYVRRRQR